MKCPACSSVMNEVKTKTAFVDICPGCKGIWFDDKELVDVLRSLVDSHSISAEKPAFLGAKSPVSAKDVPHENDRLCPRCTGTRMFKYNYAYDSNVILDKCPNCQGIWADGGEVWRIVQFLKRLQGPR